MMWVVLILVVIVIAVWPFWRESQRSPVDLSDAPGRFAELPSGLTHYRWIGPSRGPVIVAVHGLTTPSPVWISIARHLGDLGYRTLIYDLPGRGYTPAKPGVQDTAFYLDQLEELLEHQGVREDFGIIGYSMGGSIATAYAARYPERLRFLLLLASAGLAGMDGSGMSRITTAPFIGEWAHLTLGRMTLLRTLSDELEGESEVKGLVSMQRSQIRQKTFLLSVLASRRGILKEPMFEEHKKIAREGLPVYAFWGGQDEVISQNAIGRLAEYSRRANQQIIDDAGHGLPYTHGREIVRRFRDMLKDG